MTVRHLLHKILPDSSFKLFFLILFQNQSYFIKSSAKISITY
jgi:hypothetical protein